MKHIKHITENPHKKMTYDVASKAWDTLWKKHKYIFPKEDHKYEITCEYDEDEDLGYFEILRYNDTHHYYNSIGTKFLRGIPEDRMKFLKWLDELNMILK